MASTTNTTEEVTSTTNKIVEPTKRNLRIMTWRKLQESNAGVGYKFFNRIPGFVDNNLAVAQLVESDIFKKAQNIKVNTDRVLNAVKLEVLLAGKNLYLPAMRGTNALFLQVDVPADADEAQKKEILQDVEKHRTPIGMDNVVELDLVVVGSVLVSRDGYRIGRGNGFNDIEIGILVDLGAITPNTVIVTLVHELQVADNLPTELFKIYDTPVDIIFTQKEVIEVEKRLRRPDGIYWDILTERRLKTMPILNDLKEREEKAGKTIIIKEDAPRTFRRRRFGGRRYPRRNDSQTENKQSQTQDDNGQKSRRNFRRNRRFFNQRRRQPTKSEGEQSGAEAKSQERKTQGNDRARVRPMRRGRPTRDFCVKLTNISRDIRVKDLKTELRKRHCNPLTITWKGQFGKCFLHFGNRNGTPSTEEDIDKVLESLKNLTITISSEKAANDDNVTNGTNDDNTANNIEGNKTAGITNGSANVTNGGAQTNVGDGANGADGDGVSKTVHIQVELLKKNNVAAGGGDSAKTPSSTQNTSGAGDAAAGGDAGTTRIESVDTTTV